METARLREKIIEITQGDMEQDRIRAIIETVITEIQRMETRCPEYENNDYDSGAFDFRAKVLKMLDSSLE